MAPRLLALGLLALTAARDPDCGWILYPPLSQAHVEDRYRNETWGFEVALPRGIGGWMARAPNPDPGVTIILGPHRKIEVSAEADALEFMGTRALMDSMIKAEPHDGPVGRRPVGLGGLPAEEAILRHGDTRTVVVAQWLGAPDGTVDDQLWLVTDAAHEAADTAVFALTVASFRHFPRP